MNVRIFIDLDKVAVEIRHNNEKIIRYTNIQESYKGGEYSVVEESDKRFMYKISPLYEVLRTENGYIKNYNIKLTNWLNFYVYKFIRSVLDGTEFSINKEPADFSRELIEKTEIILEQDTSAK